MQKCFLTLASVVLLNSCATVFTGTTQSIQISATDKEQNQLDSVHCSLVDSAGGDYHLVSNPGTVVVPKGKGPLQVRCEETGYRNYSGAISTSFNPVTLLDIFFWPTFIVDFATGAAMKYPGHYNVVMSEQKKA